MKKIFILALVATVIAIPVYGLVSWKTFNSPTFLSTKIDCMPKVFNPDNPPFATTQVPVRKILFGVKCISW